MIISKSVSPLSTCILGVWPYLPACACVCVRVCVCMCVCVSYVYSSERRLTHFPCFCRLVFLAVIHSLLLRGTLFRPFLPILCLQHTKDKQSDSNMIWCQWCVKAHITRLTLRLCMTQYHHHTPQYQEPARKVGVCMCVCAHVSVTATQHYCLNSPLA